MVVAIAVIQFARTMIDNARDNIDTIGPDVPENKIIEVQLITESQILHLSEQCYNDQKGSLEKVMCFVLRGPIAAGVTKDTVKTSWNVPDANMTTNFDPADKALFIYYIPITNTVEVIN